MGVIDSAASARLHVLLVAAPGCDGLRMRTERVILERGGVLAATPADADVLLIAREMPERLRDPIARIWQQLPAPRVFAAIDGVEQAEETLGRARAVLADRRSTSGPPAPAADGGARMSTGDDSGDSDHHDDAPDDAEDEHQHAQADHEHQHMEHEHGHGHQHMGMDMSMDGPGGYPLASGADDRDGLEMDVLTRTLGPVLPDWDTRLLVHVELAGDLVRAASVEVLAAGGDDSVGGDDAAEHAAAGTVAAGRAAPGEGEADAAALRLDRLARLLRVVGDPRLARAAERARNVALDGDLAEARARSERLHGSIRRSVLLRWSLRGVGLAGCPVFDILLRWSAGSDAPGRAPLDADAVGAEITGRELGTARIVLAALESDDAAVPSSVASTQVRHG